jgi:hypothetical protein
MDDERILEWLTSQDVIEVRLDYPLGTINNFFFHLDIQNKRKNCTKAILAWFALFV